MYIYLWHAADSERTLISRGAIRTARITECAIWDTSVIAAERFVCGVAANIFVRLGEGGCGTGQRAASRVMIGHGLQPVAVELAHVQVQACLSAGELRVTCPPPLLALRHQSVKCIHACHVANNVIVCKLQFHMF